MLNPIYKAPSFSNLYETLGVTINELRPNLNELNWELKQYRTIEKDRDLQNNSLFQIIVLCDEILLGINYSSIDLCATLRANLCCSSQFENNYYTKYIYANIVECYKFLYYFKDTKARTQKQTFLKKLHRRLTELGFLQLKTELEAITNDLYVFGESKLIKDGLRDITYHYNQDIEVVYKQTHSVNLEEITKNVCCPFLDLTERIRKFIIKLKVTINCLLTKPLINDRYKSIEKSIVPEVISKVAERLNKREHFVPILEKFIELASKNIEGFYSQKMNIKNAEKQLLKVTQVKRLPKVVDEIEKLASVQILIYFMGGDLACAIRNYILAETSFEKEIFLSKVYFTKNATLEHFYGISEDQKKRSLWKSVLDMIPSNDEQLVTESVELSKKIESICKEDPERDILAHVADKGKNNVPSILNTLDDLNLLKNLNTAFELVSRFNSVGKFLDSLLTSMNRTQKEESYRNKQELKKRLDSIIELVNKAQIPADAKADFINSIKEENAKIWG